MEEQNDIISAVERFMRDSAPADSYTEEEVAAELGPDDEEVVGVELYLKITANVRVTKGLTPTERLTAAYDILQWSDWHPDRPDGGDYLDWFVEMDGFNLLSGPVLDGKPRRSVIDCLPPTGTWQLHSANLDIRNDDDAAEF